MDWGKVGSRIKSENALYFSKGQAACVKRSHLRVEVKTSQLACIKSALWAKRGERGILSEARNVSSPRLALRAKCRVRLAWLIKRLLCRLLHSRSYFPRVRIIVSILWLIETIIESRLDFRRSPEFFSPRWVRPAGDSTEFCTGMLCPKVQPLTLLYTVETRFTDTRFIWTRRRTIFFVPRESPYIFR